MIALLLQIGIKSCISFAVDTSKESIVQSLENLLNEDAVQIDSDGELSLDSSYDELLETVNKFASCISKVMGLATINRVVQCSIFYDEFTRIITDD